MEELSSIENYEQFKQALDTELANQAAGFVRTRGFAGTYR